MEEPIQILNVVLEDIGAPRNDGTSGSALYDVPLRLSRNPSTLWAKLCEHNWNHPPCPFTSRHQSGMCRVIGDHIILTRTTVDDVKSAHASVLKAVVAATNAEASRIEREQILQQQEQQQKAESEHNERIARAKDIKF